MSSMEDEESAAVLKAVGRQIKAWREASGMRQSELGSAIGYGEEMVSSVERGRRAPKPEFLDTADEVLGAGGKLAAMKEDVERARYPKKVRDLARLEGEAVDLGAYASHHIHGLLQTPEYTRELYAMRRPLTRRMRSTAMSPRVWLGRPSSSACPARSSPLSRKR